LTFEGIRTLAFEGQGKARGLERSVIKNGRLGNRHRRYGGLRFLQ
jgi:hypothetical protein